METPLTLPSLFKWFSSLLLTCRFLIERSVLLPCECCTHQLMPHTCKLFSFEEFSHPSRCQQCPHRISFPVSYFHSSHTQGEIVKSRSSTKVSGSKTPTTSQGVYPFTAISISQSIADQQAPKRDAFGNTGAGILSSQILDQDIAPVLRNRAQVSSGQTIVPQEGTSASSAATGGLNRFSNLRNSFSNYYSSGRRRKKLSASARVRQSRRKEGEAIPFQLNSVSQIDKFSRVFFPVTFMVINYIYWSYYLKDEEYVSNVWNG